MQMVFSQNMILHQWHFSVILTLSSDEDEDKPSGGSGGLGSGGVSGSPRSGAHTSHPEPVNHKEPIITADMENFEDSENDDTGAITGEYIDVHAKCTIAICIVVTQCNAAFFTPVTQ